VRELKLEIAAIQLHMSCLLRNEHGVSLLLLLMRVMLRYVALWLLMATMAAGILSCCRVPFETPTAILVQQQLSSAALGFLRAATCQELHKLPPHLAKSYTAGCAGRQS